MQWWLPIYGRDWHFTTVPTSWADIVLITLGEGNRIDGDDTLALDNNVLLLDPAIGLHYLIKQVESLQEEVKSLRNVVATMNQK